MGEFEEVNQIPAADQNRFSKFLVESGVSPEEAENFMERLYDKPDSPAVKEMIAIDQQLQNGQITPDEAFTEYQRIKANYPEIIN